MQRIEDATRDAASGQITAAAAEIYEAHFVPALFGQFSAPLAAAAGAGPGIRFLDVACGTGVLARAALAAGARVSAVDINESMIAVARRLAPAAECAVAPAEALPFDDNGFDAVACQFGLMFFADRPRALREMRRVCRPGGRVAVAVFDGWEDSPGYSDLIPLVASLIGPEAAAALKAPFCLGAGDALQKILDDAGFNRAEVVAQVGTVVQPSLDAWLETEIGGWTLATMVDDTAMAALKAAAPGRLGRYLRPDGSVAFPAPARFAVFEA